MSDLRHWIDFQRAFDCIARHPCTFGSHTCRPGSSGSHGRGSVRMTWYVQGDLGVVQFATLTGWMLDETPRSAWGHEMAADLGYHSPTPLYEGQMEMDCHLLADGRCFYDGSGLEAGQPWKILREQGSDAVWQFLDTYYANLFEVAS